MTYKEVAKVIESRYGAVHLKKERPHSKGDPHHLWRNKAGEKLIIVDWGDGPLPHAIITDICEWLGLSSPTDLK